MIRPTRAEVAEALGVPLVPEVIEGEGGTGSRVVLLVVVDDTDAALARLKPLVHRVVGLGWDLSPGEAARMVDVLR